MKPKDEDPRKPSCGCDAYVAGYLAFSMGLPAKAPDFLPAHTKAYRERYMLGYMEGKSRKRRLGA